MGRASSSTDGRFIFKGAREAGNGVLRGTAMMAILLALGAIPSQAKPWGRPQSAKVTGRNADIVSENLDRVSASAEQILDVLNKDAGLMVEFKKLVAEDAGASGQLLEESDMTDGAVGARLVDDLHIRVLATHFLQAYGYLL